MANEKMIYIHPAPVRVWHWVNAACFVLLVITGFQIRFAGTLGLMPLKDAINIHNYIGFLTIANYSIWLYYYFSTGKIKIYFPNPKTFIGNAIKQIQYYGFGIFLGKPNPHVMTPENKFNALQQKAYAALMFVFVPAQMITGVFMWQLKTYSNYIDQLGGIKVIDTIHVILFFFFASFLVIHCYLATLGHTPLAHFKAMFTGYEEHH
ncbi:MAG: cytochrome b/b6 domain-containing protein [Desulfobulbaceae bacterium]|uniref:Cytochrome b/b6 domain-containing protein n=1 Tax=Candidatus Desulfobia pelagia TaxID=2841692 RepID=A0A8J6TGA5_9BACT|nr:cytochrome b/b6 domain-containing protein [Candidatus Desulfobia pelagia]